MPKKWSSEASSRVGVARAFELRAEARLGDPLAHGGDARIGAALDEREQVTRVGPRVGLAEEGRRRGKTRRTAERREAEHGRAERLERAERGHAPVDRGAQTRELRAKLAATDAERDVPLRGTHPEQRGGSGLGARVVAEEAERDGPEDGGLAVAVRPEEDAPVRGRVEGQLLVGADLMKSDGLDAGGRGGLGHARMRRGSLAREPCEAAQNFVRIRERSVAKMRRLSSRRRASRLSGESSRRGPCIM